VVVHAVTEAYGAFLSRGHYPIFVLFLEIDPDRIDVNVHPTTREVRFAETESVHRLVRHAVRHALSGPERKMVLGMSAPDRTITHSLSRSLADVHGETREFPSDAAEIERGASRPGTSRPSVTVGGDQSQLTFVQEDAGAYASLSASSIVPLGQMLRRYLIAQVGQELQVIDQHTAHERVMFQRLWRRWQSRDATWQPLLIPEPVELSDAQYGLLQQHLPDLEKLGLHIEPFGQATVVIRAVPVGVGKFDAASLLQDLTDDLSQWDQLSSMEQRVPPVLASLACHSAVRAGRAMALPEIQQLIQDWVDEGLIMTCPHGRRTAFRLSTDELDKLFGRVGWS
jgi:DNA mismatch repair protein MutL